MPQPKPDWTKVTSEDLVRTNLSEYGRYVIEDRALAHVFDGLKPVQRRVLWTAWERLKLRPGSTPKKSARVVGDTLGVFHPHCLAGDTLVYALDGRPYTLEQLTRYKRKKLWVLAYDTSTGELKAAKARAFRIGQRTAQVYTVTLSDGTSVRCTGNHQFLTRANRWKQADTLRVGDLLVGGGLVDKGHPEVKLTGHRKRYVHQCVLSMSAQDTHHINGNGRDNRPKNLAALTRDSHFLLHRGSDDDEQRSQHLALGREVLFAGSDELAEANRAKNSTLMSIYNRHQGLMKAISIVKLITDRGKRPTARLYNQYRTEIYNGTRLSTLADQGIDFAGLLHLAATFRLDTSPAVGLTRPWRKRRRRSAGYSDYLPEGLTAVAATKLGRIVECIVTRGEHLTWASLDAERERWIQEHGLGLGNIYGRNIPRIKRLKKLFGRTSILVEKLSPLFCLYVTGVTVEKQDRAVPMFDFTVDGLENLFIITGSRTAAGSPNKTHTLLCAHNSAESVYQSMVNLTTQSHPLLKGEGNFGDSIRGLPAAAERYTSVSATKLLAEVFADIDVAHMVPNYTGEYEEPTYIPVTLPLLFANGSEGIAVGIAANIPPHSLQGLLKALRLVLRAPETKLATLVKALGTPEYPEGGRCISTPEEIAELYRTGTGSLTYQCEYITKASKGGHLLVVQSACPYFSLPRFLEQCDKLRAKNRIGWCEQGTKNTIALCFARDRDKLKNVLPLLQRRVRYNFVALDMDNTGNRKPVLFTLPTYLSRWLAIRRDVVERSLRAQLGKQDHDLMREGARLAAVKNLPRTLKALQHDDPVQELQRVLKLTEDQAKVILDSPLRLITQRGAGQQEKMVSGIEGEIVKIRYRLRHIDDVIETDLGTKR